MTRERIKDIKITCSDDYRLAATLYMPKSSIKAAVMLGPATGIKRQFYTHFASYLSSQGYGVITFDNRGIGESQDNEITSSTASIQCWGEKDMPAVLSSLKQYFPDTHYHLVGHSAGGQLVGLMHNSQDLSSLFNFASSSGQLSNMKYPFKFKAQFFMNVFIPFSNFLFGYTKSHLVGMGEPLPKQVAKQWQQWCNGQGYVKTAFGKTIQRHWYDELEMPSMWTNAVDDGIANNENVDDMLAVFSKAKDKAEKLTFIPTESMLKDIGHMKFFSRRSNHLWHHVIEWLERHSPGA